MRLCIRDADEAFVLALLPLLKTPAIVLDLRGSAEKGGDWQGEDLPVYHSYDALSGLCDWDDALYDTAFAGVRAAYPPPAGTKMPEAAAVPPYPDCIVLITGDAVPFADETLPASLGARRLAAHFHGERSVLQRLRSVFKGKS